MNIARDPRGPAPGAGAAGLRRLLTVLLYMLVAGLTTYVFLTKDVNFYHRSSFGDMVYGRAHRPYVYRALVPLVIRGAVALTPDAARSALAQGLAHARARKQIVEIACRSCDPQYHFEYLLFIGITAASFLGLLFLLRSLLRRCGTDADPLLATWAPAFALFSLPLFYKFAAFIYDPPTLALSALVLWAIVTRLRALLFLAFAAAALNKETALLLVPVLFIHERRRASRLVLGAQIAGLALLWGAVRVALLAAYRGNPGAAVEFHLLDHNLPLLIKDPAGVAYLALLVGLCAVLLRRGWQRRPAVLRQGLLVMIIPAAVLQLFFSYIDEIRVYYDAYPLLVLLLVPAVAEVFRGDATAPAPAPAPQARE